MQTPYSQRRQYSHLQIHTYAYRSVQMRVLYEGGEASKLREAVYSIALIALEAPGRSQLLEVCMHVCMCMHKRGSLFHCTRGAWPLTTPEGVYVCLRMYVCVCIEGSLFHCTDCTRGPWPLTTPSGERECVCVYAYVYLSVSCTSRFPHKISIHTYLHTFIQ